jgi:hypothetical protein
MIRHEKIYCRHCKHYIPLWKSIFGFRTLETVMECKLEEYRKSDWESPRGNRAYHISPMQKNRNNDCPDYCPKARWG